MPGAHRPSLSPARRAGALVRVALAGLAAVGLLGGVIGPVRAGEVRIEHVRAASDGGRRWTFQVTLRHEDAGWSHYADAWRVLAPDGTVLGERILLHPHEHEQPFTRSLSGVSVPEGVARVTVVAHDTVHGWSPDRVVVDLGRPRGERFEVER